MKLAILVLCFAFTGCSSPVAPQIHTHTNPIRPGEPGAPQIVWKGYYTDGTNWLEVGNGPDTCVVHSRLTVDVVGVRLHGHGGYLSGHKDNDWVTALYDEDRKMFWVELERHGDLDEWVNVRLDRTP